MDALQWLPHPEIGATIFNYLAELKSLMGETAAATAAMGRIPKGAKTGYKLVESLKSAEMSSIQHGIRRLESAFEQIAETILMFINYFATIPIEARSGNDIFEL